MKPNPQMQFGLTLARRIRAKIMPVFGIKQENIPIHKISRDYNYTVDVLAEKELRLMFQSAWKQGNMYGYASEDQGLVLPPNGDTEFIFLIDPIDGSRMAQIGAENACVTMVGVSGNKREATFSDIEFGITHALKENLVFVGEKGRGIYQLVDENFVPIQLRRQKPQLKDTSVMYEAYATSLRYIGFAIDPLLREVSFAMCYPCGSYCALTLIRGQNELHIDLRRRLLTDFPHLPIRYDKFTIKTLFPMDVAAGWLMIRELGGKVTDGYGRDLSNTRLWIFDKDGAWSYENEISWIAATNPKLHAQVMAKIEEGFKTLRKL